MRGGAVAYAVVAALVAWNAAAAQSGSIITAFQRQCANDRASK